MPRDRATSRLPYTPFSAATPTPSANRRGVGRPTTVADAEPIARLLQLAPFDVLTPGRPWGTIASRIGDGERPVLVTAPSAGTVTTARERADFLRRASIAVMFGDAPNAVRYESVWVGNDQAFLFGEYFEGCRLADWMAFHRAAPRPLSVATAVLVTIDVLRFAEAVCQRVGRAQRYGESFRFPHVDPFAIYLDTDGRVRVSGFDAAGGGMLSVVEQGLAFDELRYVPPETLHAPPGERSLVYSACILLWELVEHRPAFGDLREVALRASTDESGLTLAVEPLLAQVIARATRPRADQRPSVVELRRLLEDWFAEAANEADCRRELARTVAPVVAHRRLAKAARAQPLEGAPPEGAPRGRLTRALVFLAFVVATTCSAVCIVMR